MLRTRISTLHHTFELMFDCTVCLPPTLQENLRRLLSANDASSDFNSWCKQELQKFNTDVDGKQTIPRACTVVTVTTAWISTSLVCFHCGNEILCFVNDS